MVGVYLYLNQKAGNFGGGHVPLSESCTLNQKTGSFGAGHLLLFESERRQPWCWAFTFI